MDSKVELLFREKGWEIIWTPPYCPKFQMIELVWGVGKQRAGTLYKPGRSLKSTKKHLRRGWYGGKGKTTARFEACNVRGCWETAEGVMGSLEGAERWTESIEECLSIQDMEGVGTIEEDTAAEEPETGAAAAREEAETAVQVAAAHLGGADNAAAEPE